MTPAERSAKRKTYLGLIALRDYFNSLAEKAKTEIWADEPSAFWRGVREAGEEVSTWPQWKIDSAREILRVEPRECKPRRD